MDNATLKKAIETYGGLMQTIVAIEEMAELIKELCKQLRGRENLEEIAEESGFSSLPYFNKVFKAFVGYTPAAYRHQLSKRADLT